MTVSAPIAFTGVVLAGGRSTRMGRDKAALPFQESTLLAHQLDLLHQAGAAEVLVSFATSPTRDPGVPVLLDRWPDAGPLAGIERALAAARHELVLVLAVDLPGMTAEFLRELSRGSSAACGLVPTGMQGHEPLAACYPRRAHPLAAGQLAAGHRSLQAFVDACVAAGLVSLRPVAAAESCLFTNWNTPADVAATAPRP